MATIVPINSRNDFHSIIMCADLFPGEDPAAFQRLLAEWTDEFQPVGVEERHLVYEIVSGIWCDERYARMGNKILRRFAIDGCFDATDQVVLDRLDRIRSEARRQVALARKELRRIQKEDCAPEPDPFKVDTKPRHKRAKGFEYRIS
jgi:hypothetical protein